MKVVVIPNQDFVHGDLNVREGQALEVEQGLAVDLEAHGLWRISGVLSGPYARSALLGNVLAAGPVQSSSASPAVPALLKKIATGFGNGARKSGGRVAR